MAMNDLILRFYSVEIHVTGTKAEKAARAALCAGEFVDMYELNRLTIERIEAAGLHVSRVEQYDSFVRLYVEQKKAAPKGGDL